MGDFSTFLIGLLPSCASFPWIFITESAAQNGTRAVFGKALGRLGWGIGGFAALNAILWTGYSAAEVSHGISSPREAFAKAVSSTTTYSAAAIMGCLGAIAGRALFRSSSVSVWSTAALASSMIFSSGTYGCIAENK